MAISARASRALHQALGEEAADDMVNWMSGIETTRAELRELNDLSGQRNEARIDVRFAEYDRKLDTRFVEFERRFDAKLDTRFADFEGRLEAKLDARFADFEVKLERRFSDLLKWSFVFWLGAVGAIAALAGLFR
jgi:hypothetical protein